MSDVYGLSTFLFAAFRVVVVLCVVAFGFGFGFVAAGFVVCCCFAFGHGIRGGRCTAAAVEGRKLE